MLMIMVKALQLWMRLQFLQRNEDDDDNDDDDAEGQEIGVIKENAPE